MFVRVEEVRIFSDDDDISLKEPVSLMARQEKLKGVICDTNRIAFGDFSGVAKFGVIWVCHFTEAEEVKEACEELCKE